MEGDYYEDPLTTPIQWFDAFPIQENDKFNLLLFGIFLQSCSGERWVELSDSFGCFACSNSILEDARSSEKMAYDV